MIAASAASAVAIIGLIRGWRVALLITSDGMTVRNPCRTYEMPWNQIASLTDGRVNAGKSWVMLIVPQEGRRVVVRGTMGMEGEECARTIRRLVNSGRTSPNLDKVARRELLIPMPTGAQRSRATCPRTSASSGDTRCPTRSLR